MQETIIKLLANTLSTYDIVNADSVVIVKDAVKMLEEVYA